MQSILIVDDRNENLAALESLLERPDLRLLKSDNGHDALKLLLGHDVALVLLDVQMPGMDGFEVAELMRRNKKTRSIPVIFVSAHGDKRQVFRGYEVGAVDFLAKPVERDVLQSKVRVFLELDRQRRALQAQLRQIQELRLQNERLLEALGDGVLAVDADGQVSFANPALLHLFGIEAAAVVGRPLTELLFPGAEPRAQAWSATAVCQASLKGERLQCDAGYFVRSGEHMLPALVSAARIPSTEGYAGAVITLRPGTATPRDDLLEEIARKNRKRSRKRIGAVLRLFDRGSGRNLGRLANISLDGFKLTSREAIAVGSRHQISMVLPETLEGSNTLSFDAQVMWCKPAADMPSEFRTGFRIICIGENDLRILQQLVERY